MAKVLVDGDQGLIAHRVANERKFRSVFPPRRYVQPTPQASPFIGPPSSPAGEHALNDLGTAVAERLTQREAAWTLMTQWLRVTGSPKQRPPGLNAALDTLTSGDKASERQSDLLAWMDSEVRQSFETEDTPRLDRLWQRDIFGEQSHEILAKTATYLLHRQGLIIDPLQQWLHVYEERASLGSQSEQTCLFMVQLFRTARSTFHAAVRRSLPSEKFLACLTYLFVDILGGRGSPQSTDRVSNQSGTLLQQLKAAGLTGDTANQALAVAIQAAIHQYVGSHAMRVDWIGQQSRASALSDWIETNLRPSVQACLVSLMGSEFTLPPSEVETWQNMALNCLGRSRLMYLSTYVQLWPQSLGAILDLREYLFLPSAKAHLARVFIDQLSARICHAGATTAELLTIYVSVIRVFKALDNRSVLLEKVSTPLRNILRSRDDTVRAIAASFLAELDENDSLLPSTTNAHDVCIEITKEVLRSENRDLATNESRLDWDDMDWLPDPIDAGPDYKTNKNNDVISYMLTLFEREVFVKEVQNILGERLLRSEDEELTMERRLVDMLKLRLGADKLQAAEVMVRDMADSARIGRHLRNVAGKLPSARAVWEAIPEEGLPFVELVKKLGIYVPSNAELKKRFIEVLKQAAIPGDGEQKSTLFRRPGASFVADGEKAAFEAKVLSSFFWPELRDDEFKIPDEIRRLEKEYEAGFKRVKTQRRLKWMSALGRATVELELADRTVKLEGVKTWVAAIIYAFQALPDVDGMDVDEDDSKMRKTINELEEELNMDEALVRNATSFWVSQRVLKEVEPDIFEVLESLEDDRGEQVLPIPTQPAEEAVSALKSQNAVLKDNKGMYEMFIVGMLTNGGSMDAGRVAMMLKMVVPGGFGFGEEEVTWLLQGMEGDGKVAKNGDAWAIKK